MKTWFPYLQNINVPLEIGADLVLSDTPVGSTNQKQRRQIGASDTLCTYLLGG